ncbi:MULTISPECIES: DUF5686 and carboxypeptidase regulatory-like domain-containing protein [Chitinophagaceae]
MNAKLSFFVVSILISGIAYSQKQTANILGTVRDGKGNPIAYASVFIQNGIGTTADANGKYKLNLGPGNYTVVCQFIGYQAASQTVIVSDVTQTLDFSLTPITSHLEDVVIRTSKKDPANSIIRNAIRMKPQYRAPLDSFTCDVYIKMQIQSRAVPKKVLFKKIGEDDKKEMGVDSTGKGMVYLSESLTQYAFRKPKQSKLNIIAGRESGSNGYGFNFPTFIPFYNDNVQILSFVGDRGYVSPIADAAFHYYNFRYIGFFNENGKKIHRIRLQPKRKYEPLFDGEISITDGDWHIYSVDVLVTKEAQLQLLDTIHIQQQAAPIAENIWEPNKLIVHFSFNVLGFNMFGSTLNVYNNYNTKPTFPPNYFSNIVAQYQKDVNRRNTDYWDSLRPVQLTEQEQTDYHRKDSTFQSNQILKNNKTHQDSIYGMRERFTLGKLLSGGYSKSFRNDSGKASNYLSVDPLLTRLQYNTVEGISLNSSLTWTHLFRNNNLFVMPHLRYGFSNGHLNPEIRIIWQKQKDSTMASKAYRYWSLSGGKKLSQYNNNNPISPLVNEIHTLFWGQNYMKLYENSYLNTAFSKGYENGFSWNAFARYENRTYVANSAFITAKKHPEFTPNYPTELISAPFVENKAFIVGIGMRYQPGQRYIQYPYSKVSIGSKAPTFTLSYQKGIDRVFKSTSNFDKWNIGLQNSYDLRLGGIFKYKFDMGGFLNKKAVAIQDYVHFNGNQTLFASTYLNGFQLAPYYANSTIASFYATGHIEHHFNGMLTNKIPLLRTLNWNLVAGSNAFYVNSKNNYVEVFMGVENIFKAARIDFIQSFLNGSEHQFGVRLGFGGIFSNSKSNLDLN